MQHCLRYFLTNVRFTEKSNHQAAQISHMGNHLRSPCSRESRKKSERLLPPSARPDLDIKGRLLPNSRPKMWDIQDNFLFGCLQTLDTTGLFKKFCIATRTNEAQHPKGCWASLVWARPVFSLLSWMSHVCKVMPPGLFFALPQSDRLPADWLLR